MTNPEINALADSLAEFRKTHSPQLKRAEETLRKALRDAGKTKPPDHNLFLCGIDFADSCLTCRRSWLERSV